MRYAICVALGVAILFTGGCRAGVSYPVPAELPSVADMPDALTMLDGLTVQTSADWFGKRRPELQRLFEHYMYGTAPAAPPLQARVLFEDSSYLNGRVTLREIAIALTPDRTGPVMRLLVATPNDAKGPVPCFVGPNFNGNHTLATSDRVALPEVWVPNWAAGQVNNRATAAGRATRLHQFPIDDVTQRGYAVASFYYGDVEVDKADRGEGIRAWYAAHDSGRQYDWGAIAAWAWGVSRAVDWLVTDSRIDATRIAAMGHSRNGKAVLLAAAFDQRIALAIPHQSGCGGAAPSRGTAGESVKQITTAFPHWFSPAFSAFGDGPDRLPFDQHCLVAMVAPRPCLLTNAEKDLWANPAGQFQVLQAADKVYRLLGAEGLNASEMPDSGTLVDSQLGYWIRPGRHGTNREDWEVFLRYADKRLGSE